MTVTENPSRAAEAFAREVLNSLADGTFVRLAISSPVDPAESAGKILGRCIVLKDVPQLSLTFRHATNDVTKNLAAHESQTWLCAQLGTHYRSALLGTTRLDWQFISKPDAEARLISHKATTKKAPSRAHDQPKVSLLDSSAADWLIGLEVLDRDGKLRASMADKHRQISHYLEILSHLAKECGWIVSDEVITPASEPKLAHTRSETSGASSRDTKELVLADMGCGKGYLTFGAWHYFRRVCRLPVNVIGVVPTAARSVGFVIRTVGGFTNVASTERVVALPARSFAVTENEFSPSTRGSTSSNDCVKPRSAPFKTTLTRLSSVAVPLMVRLDKRRTGPPTAGSVTVTVGGVLSRLTVVNADDTFPARSMDTPVTS